MAAPFASIIIPTRNRAADLERCLAILRPQIDSAEREIDLHICDDSSNLETKQMLAEHCPGAYRHEGPRLGPGPNRNVGAKAARGEWLIFLDDDILPRPELIPAYLKAMQQYAGQEVVLSGATYRLDEHKDSILWEAPENVDGRSLPPSCNFAMPRALFEKAGGFDERYRISFEDIEFFARLTLSGTVVHFVPEAAVDHPSRPIPPARSLARRWEARVTSTYDYGAKTSEVIWRLPRHIVMVILSRFRGKKTSPETIKAAGIFALEFGHVLSLLPSWIKQHAKAPRSAFWRAQQRAGQTPPRYGL